MEGKKLENIILDLEPIENVLMDSLKSLHLEREYNYTLDLLHSQFVHTVHDLEVLHKDKIAWYLLHLPNVLKVELVNTMIKRDIHNKKVEHQSEVAHDKRVEAAKHDKYDWSVKHHHNKSDTSSTDGSMTSADSAATSDTDWVTSYSAADKCYYYYNTISGESTWECPDLTKHYQFVDWKIPEVQETVHDPHSPLPAGKLHQKEHHHQHNHHLHAHVRGRIDATKGSTDEDVPAIGSHTPTIGKTDKDDNMSVESRPTTLVDENYHPKKKIHHPSLTLLERMTSLKRYTMGKWNS